MARRVTVINGILCEAPMGAAAFRYTDSIEDARWIYDRKEACSIAREDFVLIAWTVGIPPEVDLDSIEIVLFTPKIESRICEDLVERHELFMAPGLILPGWFVEDDAGIGEEKYYPDAQSADEAARRYRAECCEDGKIHAWRCLYLLEGVDGPYHYTIDAVEFPAIETARRRKRSHAAAAC